MADGTELVADAWLPSDGGRYPVLLQRLPYGRTVASSLVLPHPSWFARHGYAVVVQDCRGRGDSGGTFEPFVDEGADGAATIEWAAGLPFADGRVATYGFSYQGLNQLYAAARRPKGLCAIAPMMCARDPYEGWTYEGGTL
ncbi:MAG: CocE/NonD family hydrolase, partial [Actinobacteria bacterium]|nr:CocE/NonD family hydrolase [Actinomycetota bacterium]